MKSTTHLRSNPKERDSSEEHRTRAHISEDGTLTLLRDPFQETYADLPTGETPQDYNSRTESPIFSLSCSRFSRPY